MEREREDKEHKTMNCLSVSLMKSEKKEREEENEKGERGTSKKRLRSGHSRPPLSLSIGKRRPIS
jgi:hypothetical protein